MGGILKLVISVIFVMSISLTLRADTTQSCVEAGKLNSKLTCGVFINGLPEGEIGIKINGKSPTQESKVLTTKNGKYRTEVAWDGYFGGVPRNPELRVQLLSGKDETVLVESYKNFDLHKMEKETEKSVSENDDNVGLRTADDVIYLSCNYQKLESADCK